MLEGDEDDTLVVYTGDKCGEELLAEYYAPIASTSMMDMKVNQNEAITNDVMCILKQII